MQVMEFINTLKGHKNAGGNHAHDILTQIFSRGNCYMFARTLKLVFPEGELYNFELWGVHILFKLGDRFYDINGDVTARYSNSGLINPITEAQENYARTFCYSHEMESACGLDSGSRSMSETEFRKSLKIDSHQIEDKTVVIA
jgi:hypothetical protein